jgi:hypothetical protein
VQAFCNRHGQGRSDGAAIYGDDGRLSLWLRRIATGDMLLDDA